MIYLQIVSIRLRLGGRQASIQLACSIDMRSGSHQKINVGKQAAVWQIRNEKFDLDNIGQHRTPSTTPQSPPSSGLIGADGGALLWICAWNNLGLDFGVGYSICIRIPRLRLTWTGYDFEEVL